MTTSHAYQLTPNDVFPKLDSHPYYIVVPPWVRTSAGVKILHQLAHVLNLKGYFAYLVTSKTGPYVMTRLLTQEAIALHFEAGRTPIVVYSETLHGNPFNAPCVARFLGNFPGLLGGPSELPAGDLVFGYSRELLEALPERHRDNVLCMPGSDFNVFHLPDQPRTRRGACYYAGKYKYFHGEQTLPITDGAVEITRDLPGSQTPQQIAELFWSSEVFYCYENSALSVEAVLCGCPVVLLPNKHFDKIIAKDEVSDSGLAWGSSAEELARAKRTLPLAHAKYMQRFDRFFLQLEHFISVTQTRAASIEYKEPIRRVRLPFEKCVNIVGEPAPREIPPGAVNHLLAAVAVTAQLILEAGFLGFCKKVLRYLRAGGLKAVGARMRTVYDRM